MDLIVVVCWFRHLGLKKYSFGGVVLYLGPSFAVFGSGYDNETRIQTLEMIANPFQTSNLGSILDTTTAEKNCIPVSMTKHRCLGFMYSLTPPCEQ